MLVRDQQGFLWGVTAIVLCLAPVCVHGTPTPGSVAPKGYTSRAWGVQDGLPENMVLSLAQTADGYLWLGTTGGLVRFDGVSFSVFTRENTPQLRDNTIWTLLPTSEGDLWIGTLGGGLVRYRKGEWRNFHTAEGLTNLFVYSVFQDSRKDLWVGTEDGLFRRKGDRFEEVSYRAEPSGGHIAKVFEDSLGRLWVAGTGIYVRERGASRFVCQDKSLSQLTFRSIAETRDGTLWAATVNGLLQLERGAARFRPITDVPRLVQTLYTDRAGSLWIGIAGKGLIHLENGRFVPLPAPDAEPGSQPWAILEDAERNLWIGTNSGLVCWRPSSVDTISVASGKSETVRTVYRDPTGIVWAASVSGTLYQVHGRTLVPARVPASLAGAKVRNVFRDRSGALWIGTSGDGAFRLWDGSLKLYGVRDGLPSDFIRAFAQAPDGSMWVGTDGGLAHITSANVESIQRQAEGLAYSSVRCLHVDRTGVLWIGTDRGLSRRDAHQFIHDAVTASLQDEKIWAIHEDPHGAIWLGTRGGGLFRVKNGEVARFTTRNGLASNEIFQVLEDGHGSLWMSGPTGVSTINRAELEKTLESGSRAAMHLFGVSDGMDTTRLTSGVQPAGCVSEGVLWFPSAGGLARFESGAARHDGLSPALIEEVIANGGRVAQENVVLGPGKGRLEIRYNAVALRTPGRILFRYMLKGIDQEWMDAQGARSVHYANLPPGKYVFRVQSFDVGAPDVVSEAALPIEWQPLLYQRAWFLALCAIGAIAAAWLFHVSQMRRKHQSFALVLEERKRVARDMHDTLIQGCLGVLVLLEAAGSTREESSGSGNTLVDRAREQIRSTIDEARRAVWDLRKKPADGDTLAAELARLANRVRAESQIPVQFLRRGRIRPTAKELEDGLVLVVREAVANAVRHGRPRNIRIELGYGFRSVEILISDDGQGFTPPEPGTRNSQHYGLIGMRERIEHLRGTFRLESMPGCGTTIQLRIPNTKGKDKNGRG